MYFFLICDKATWVHKLEPGFVPYVSLTNLLGNQSHPYDGSQIQGR